MNVLDYLSSSEKTSIPCAISRALVAEINGYDLQVELDLIVDEMVSNHWNRSAANGIVNKLVASHR